MRKCKVCGATFTRGETHCPYCGANLITGKMDAQEPQGKKENTQQRHQPHNGEPENRKAGRNPFAGKQGQTRQNSQHTTVPPGTSQSPPPLKMFSRMNNLIAAILAFALGTFGVQWFYLGDYRKGIRRLIFFWTGIPTIIGLMEGVMFLGRFVRDDLPLLP